MATIHATAIIDPKAEIADDAAIGPFCVVGPWVRIESGARLLSHVVVDGRTVIGAETEIYPFASIGSPPQDLKYDGEPSELIIGRSNRIREHVTMNPGTQGGGMRTVIGDHGLFMVGAHVAHDCRIGDHVVMANNATLGGHVQVGDHAIIGGLAAIHQFVRIGRHAMISGMTGVKHDVIPFGTVTSRTGALDGLNVIGLKRRGFDRDQIQRLKEAYKVLFGEERTLEERAATLAADFDRDDAVMELVSFVRDASNRPLCQPHGRHG